MITTDEKLFVGPEFKQLLKFYHEAGVYVDSLPHTKEIEQIASRLTAFTRRKITEQEVHKLLVAARKNKVVGEEIKGLIKRKKAEHPEWYFTQLGFVGILYEEVSQEIASDELPYSKEFDDMHEVFLRATGISATKKEFFGAIMFYRKGYEEGEAGRARRALAEYIAKIKERKESRETCGLLFQ